MSRKAIIEFRKVANSQTLDVDKYFFDNIIPIYEDSVHTPQERATTLEKDTLWLLTDMVQADKVIDRSNPDRQQRIPFFNYRNLLQSLILSTADKGIYLSEAFVKAYENVDMGAYSFGEFVRNAYKPAWWEVQPQQKHTEAPQQANRGNSGELAGNGKEVQPQGKEQPVINKEELPTIYDDEVNKDREQQVLYNAIQRGWMELNGTSYNWLKNINHLAFMCGLLYWGDKVTDDKGANTDSLGEYPKILSKSSHRFKYNHEGITKTSKDIMELFGGVNVSNYRSQLNGLPEEYGSIMRLFPQIKTGL